MSTRLRPTKRNDGRYRATIRVAFDPCLEDVIEILAAKGDPESEVPVSYVRLHEMITDCYHEAGREVVKGLGEQFEDGEWRQRMTWATMQVKRLYPTWKPASR